MARNYTEEEFRKAAREAGYPTAADVIMMELKRESVVSDNAEFTMKELKGWTVRHAAVSLHGADPAEVIAKDILEHREPQYPDPVNTIVKSATGTWYQRCTGGWRMFGSSGIALFDTPIRPLEVM